MDGSSRSPVLPAELPERWRTRANELRRFAPPAAEAFDAAAEELADALAALGEEPLTLAQAQAESGYTEGHLRRLLREATVPNAGTPEEPRILRRHLPRKPGFGIVAKADEPMVLSRRQIARAVALGE